MEHGAYIILRLAKEKYNFTVVGVCGNSCLVRISHRGDMPPVPWPLRKIKIMLWYLWLQNWSRAGRYYGSPYTVLVVNKSDNSHCYLSSWKATLPTYWMSLHKLWYANNSPLLACNPPPPAVSVRINNTYLLVHSLYLSCFNDWVNKHRNLSGQCLHLFNSLLSGSFFYVGSMNQCKRGGVGLFIHYNN